ncbi:MAG: Unknown protein [uncultured Sulfurovum sp.]|uniref:Uncharacterized protein n=1 Tax=uncultured Sulfurovum sp. TaxID=269237 RepID=A0A6S6SDW5_9BACT|nr:MAG: Unknown protein [uncultured Sulfurovum sp.]
MIDVSELQEVMKLIESNQKKMLTGLINLANNDIFIGGELERKLNPSKPIEKGRIVHEEHTEIEESVQKLYHDMDSVKLLEAVKRIESSQQKSITQLEALERNDVLIMGMINTLRRKG